MSTNSTVGIRSFNERGRQKFSELIGEQQDRVPDQSSATPTYPYMDLKPFEELASKFEYSDKVDHTESVHTDPDLGSTKFAMAKYLDDKLPVETFDMVYENHGMWEWLACLWIKNFIHKKRDKSSPSGWKPPFNFPWLQIRDAGWYKTRHCIKDFSYYYRKYKVDDWKQHPARVLLSTSLNEFGEIENQFFINEIPAINKNVLEYMNEFFFEGFSGEDPQVRAGIRGTSKKDSDGNFKFPYRAGRIKCFSLLWARSFNLDLVPYKKYRELMQQKLKIPKLKAPERP